MSPTFHYLIMSEHSMFQKELFGCHGFRKLYFRLVAPLRKNSRPMPFQIVVFQIEFPAFKRTAIRNRESGGIPRFGVFDKLPRT